MVHHFDPGAAEPSENIIVRDNHCATGVNAVCIGSEISGGVRRVLVQGEQRAGRVENAIQFKSNKDRGAYIEDIYVTGVSADHVSACLSFTNQYHSWRGGDFPTTFRNITIENVTCARASGSPIDIEGLPERPIDAVTLRNVAISRAARRSVISGTSRLRLLNVTVNGVPINGSGARYHAS